MHRIDADALADYAHRRAVHLHQVARHWHAALLHQPGTTDAMAQLRLIEVAAEAVLGLHEIADALRALGAADAAQHVVRTIEATHRLCINLAHEARSALVALPPDAMPPALGGAAA